MYGTFLAKESPLLFKQNSQKILEWINLIVVSDLNGKIYAGPPSAYRPIRARLAQSGPGSPNQGPARPIRARLASH